MPIGYQFPFQVSSGSVGYFQMTNTELQAAASNLKILLLTNRGERPMNFDFGCNLREFLFEDLSKNDLGQHVADRILQQISRWMPFVAVTKLNVLFNSDDSSIRENEMYIKISFSLVGRPQEISSISLSVNSAGGTGTSTLAGLVSNGVGGSGGGGFNEQ